MSTASVAGMRVWESSISRTVRRSTPCAASANATARSAVSRGRRDPLALPRFRDELGLDELYVADLDAITGGGETAP